MSNCSVFRLFSKLCRTFARGWLLFFISVLIIVSWKVSVGIRNSKILIILSIWWCSYVTWVCSSWCSCSILCTSYFLLHWVILRLSARRWNRATSWIVLDWSCCTGRRLWSVGGCSSLRNSQSSIIFRITSITKLLIWDLIEVVI